MPSKATLEISARIAAMPADARLDVRLPRALLDGIEAYAATHGWTVTQTVRVLLATEERAELTTNKGA